MTQVLWVALGAVVGLLLAMSLSQLWMTLRARRSVGQSAPEIGPALAPGAALVYFSSPTCGPCRAMTPRIEALRSHGAQIHTVDVTQQPEVASAYGVMATPTTVAVRDGLICEVIVGIVPQEKLIALLA